MLLKNYILLTEPGPLSAFAARKGLPKPIRRVASPTIAEQVVSSDPTNEVEAPVYRRKRQRTAQSSHNAPPVLQRTQQNGHQGKLEPVSEDIVVLESTSSDGDSEGQAERYAMGQCVKTS